MAIAFVQKSAVANFAFAATASPTLSGTVATNTVLCIVTHWATDGSTPTFTINDGTAYNQDVYTNVPTFNSLIASHYAIAGGTVTTNVTASSGVNSAGCAQLVEFSGIMTGGFDARAIANANSNTPAVGPTGSLATGLELFIASMVNQMAGGYTTPPTGGPGTFTNLHTGSSDGYTQVDNDYQIGTSSTSPVSVSWGTTSIAEPWAAAVATYKATGSSTLSADILCGMDTQEWLADALRLTATQYQQQAMAMRGSGAAQYPVPLPTYQPFTYRQFFPRRIIIT